MGVHAYSHAWVCMNMMGLLYDYTTVLMALECTQMIDVVK